MLRHPSVGFVSGVLHHNFFFSKALAYLRDNSKCRRGAYLTQFLVNAQRAAIAAMHVTRDFSLLDSTGKVDNIAESTLLKYAVLKVE